ncbi:collagen a3 [Stigmatella aurantiaca DW4/3-1]|uniref:Collagen a3 n=1 Tax=Stigmatella aurantiaca (strain DW4/3-1) TaxID=378806 RepID=Q08TB3_STIAD|nr:collagen a3 [Stigmatella aurantiaca DW4/3-1]
MGGRAVPQLALAVVAPGRDGAVGVHRQRVEGPRGHGEHAAQAGNGPGRGGLAGGRPIALLAVAIEAPGPDGAFRAQRQGVEEARGHAAHAAQPGDGAGRGAVGKSAIAQLAIAVEPPGRQGAIGVHGQRVVAPAGHRGHVPQPGNGPGHRAARGGAIPQLAIVVGAPGPDGVIVSHHQRVEAPRGHGTHAAQPGDGARREPLGGGAVAELAKLVEPPGPDGAIRAQRQRVSEPGGHGAHPAQPGHLHRQGAGGGGAIAELAIGVAAPRPEGAIGAHRQGVGPSRGHGDDVAQSGHRHGREAPGERPLFPEARSAGAPRPDGAIGVHRQRVRIARRQRDARALARTAQGRGGPRALHLPKRRGGERSRSRTWHRRSPRERLEKGTRSRQRGAAGDTGRRSCGRLLCGGSPRCKHASDNPTRWPVNGYPYSWPSPGKEIEREGDRPAEATADEPHCTDPRWAGHVPEVICGALAGPGGRAPAPSTPTPDRGRYLVTAKTRSSWSSYSPWPQAVELVLPP